MSSALAHPDALGRFALEHFVPTSDPQRGYGPRGRTSEYQATVDQRNARIPLSQAKDNNMPPAGNAGGRGDLQGATPEQHAAVAEMKMTIAA